MTRDSVQAEDDAAEFVGCETCDNTRVPFEDAVRMADFYVCPKCWKQWQEEYSACAHDLQPHVDDMGDDCQICRECSGLVYPPAPIFTKARIVAAVHWLASALQIAGAILLALNLSWSPYAYVPMLAGSMVWTITGLAARDWPLVAMMGGFAAINLIGIARWLL